MSGAGRTLAASVLLALALAAAPARAQFPHDQYAADTLGRLSAELDRQAPVQPGVSRAALYRTVTKLKVVATYTGERRPVSRKVAGLILDYVQEITADPAAYAALYRHAYAFDEGGRRYWFPVQHQVADYFAEELKPGRRIELYVLALGGIAEADQPMEPLLLVQEYDGEIDQRR